MACILFLPGKTKAGSAGEQPCQGIARRGSSDGEQGVDQTFAPFPKYTLEIDPQCLKKPRGLGQSPSCFPRCIKLKKVFQSSLNQNRICPFHAEPIQHLFTNPSTLNHKSFDI